MSSTPLSAVQETVAQMQRPARVLLGWMTEEQALHFLSGQRRDVELNADQREHFRCAQAAVAARKAGIDQSGAVMEPPAELSAYISALQQAPAAKVFFDQGWRVAVIDLEKICSLQTHVFIDHAEERTSGARADNIESLARVSLPLPTEVQLPAQYDQHRQAWMISSPNPNLRIVGNWAGAVQPGLMGFGFAVTVLPSFLQVARVQKRYVLRDGYHRAVGFLKQGISKVPTLVRDYAEFEDLGLPPGLFPPAVYLGERPPRLVDFLSDDVSAEVSLPASQRMIVVHGLELTPFG